MRAAVFDGKNIELKERDIPKIAPNQVLLKLKNSGICGTDISIFQGHLPTPVPIIPGHELSGIIEKVGANVRKDLISKRVTSEINANICGTCYFCKNGIPTNCIHRKALGIDIDGAFAEYIAIDKYLVHELPDNVTFEQGTFVEPLAAAVNTFELMPFDSKDKWIAIFGAGKLGLLILQVAKNYHRVFPEIIQNSPKIVVVNRTEEKLKIAKKLSADYLINSSTEDPVKKIKELTDGLGADIVVETTGNPTMMNQVTESTRTRGKIALKSTHGLPTPINITDVVVREISLYGTRCGPFDKALKFMNKDLINTDILVGSKFALTNIKEAFKEAESGNSIKVLIENEK